MGDIKLAAAVGALTGPTVGALAKIARAMGTDVAYFVEKRNVSNVSVVRKDERRKMQFKDWGATYLSLTKDLPHPRISFLEVELDPGVARPEETSTHDGEEFALVTKGVMEIIIGVFMGGFYSTTGERVALGTA